MAEDPHILGLALGGGAFGGTPILAERKAWKEKGFRPEFFFVTSAVEREESFSLFAILREKFRTLCLICRWRKPTNFSFSKFVYFSTMKMASLL